MEIIRTDNYIRDDNQGHVDTRNFDHNSTNMFDWIGVLVFIISLTRLTMVV